ncbi:MAG: hypothetical protein NZ561_04645, partial [Phycisphaerae bacterium]|nr:hypothetical protein [Phycisphaerae bacterium]MDW8262635.1 hypothetical protein [Phycisphaerales bacterium]
MVLSVRVGLVGHCRPDASYLIQVLRSVGVLEPVRINDDNTLSDFLTEGPAVLLVNRVLDGDFEDSDGVGLIARVRRKHPSVVC